MKIFLLDTGVMLGFVRGAPWAITVRAEYDLGNPETIVMTSVICQGELLALAEKRGWGEASRLELSRTLNRVPTLDINKQSILKAYALIDAWTHGKLVASPRNGPPPKPARSIGKNDLWIAATAHASDAILLTTDTDFDHLDGVWFKRIHVSPR